MAITFNVDDIKPLLGTFGLGQAPSSKLPDMQNIPVPPMPLPPKPTPAQAGFTAYAADPLNQQKVMNSITPPGQPIIPPTPSVNTPPMAAVTPPSVTPPSDTPSSVASSNGPLVPSTAVSPATPAPIQTLAQWQAANPGSVETPMGNKMRIFQAITAGLLGAAGGVRKNNPDPMEGVNYANGVVANQQGITGRNQARYNSAVVQPLQDAAKLADVQSQTAERNSASNKSDALADAITPFTMTKEQATAINHPELAGTQTTGRDYTKMLTGAGNNNTSSGNNAATNATKVTTTGMNNDTSMSNNSANNDRAKSVAAASDKTKTLIAQMHDATSRANNANTNEHKGTTGAGGFKVPAMITNRASLASNVNDNVARAQQLISKRPDIMGAEGGRYTNVQQMIGSNDPDINELGVVMHNIALASNGAHGLKGSGAVEKTEGDLFHNFKTGPQGVQGSLKGISDSMQTFLDDEKNFQTTGNRTGSGNALTPPAPNTPANSIPAAASAQLQEGVSHTFGNGQVWTKKNGAPTRLK